MIAILLGLAGCAGVALSPETAAATPEVRQEPVVSHPCTVKLTPTDDLAAALAEGGVICLAPGKYTGGLWIEKSVILQGEPGAIIDAGGRGPAVYVTTDDQKVELHGLTFTGGSSELGGGLRVEAWSDVLVENCVFDGNRAMQGGANGIGISAGNVKFVKTRTAKSDDVLITGPAEVEFHDSAIEGAVRLREGSQVQMSGGSVGGGITVAGTTTRAPTLTYKGTKITGGVDNDKQLPGKITEQ